MKSELKTSPFCRFVNDLLLCSMVFLLGGCGINIPPRSWTDEPSDEVINAPRAVAHPSNYNGNDWGNLGDVPDRPTNFVPQSEWTQVEDTLQADRDASEGARARLERTAPAFETPRKPR